MAASPFISTLILDAGPIISNTTLPKAATYYTTPAVLAELKDENARSRLLSLYALQTRTPRKESIDFVRGFAKKTGDAEVLSGADVGIIALTYELECEQNGGDWRLRNAPGQARINGKPPVREVQETQVTTEDTRGEGESEVQDAAKSISNMAISEPAASTDIESLGEPAAANVEQRVETTDASGTVETVESSTSASTGEDATNGERVIEIPEEFSEEDDDDDDWITPSNIKKHQEQDSNIDATAQDVKTMKVACATHDFALQNVLLQIGLNLVSGDGKRISSVKTWVLRCHACFKVSRKMNLKFCPSCGGATLMRTSVSTDSKGAMKVHLKRNMQWNNRGTVYSIPKQQHGTANMKGRDNLILRADQREVEKLEKRDKYKKEIDLLDPDYVPSIVSGRRDMNGSSIKFGHGKRNVNSNRKR